ncbi:ATP-binding protein [Actinacidiphila paucisporea]|uniref:Anti-sigma regulatory factor (Ser/Thr protein kinase) n=1 Tax=Actinacidiphila paucisporea TaxID=310782 RepID=A0A1M7NZ16_9ACTN|nr:ATP-binding protein [Actinacidiphila paucisporea]SHN09487.1 Anti-sigma regulatory factor (Ser/Thr protein kinase) [Actinacidiphila paucisporea]
MELPPATPHDARPPEVRVDFDGASGCIAEARDVAGLFLRDHAPHAGGTFPDDVLLVVSELVTNAVRHAPGPLTLTVCLLPGGIGITVRDTGPGRPYTRTPDRTGGRGWPIVQSLARRVHVVPEHGGKTVQAELDW